MSDRTLRIECDILEALGDKHMTALQLSERAGWSHPTVHKYLRKLEAENKVRIIGWASHVVMLWAQGAGYPAPRPAKSDKKANMKRWRAKNREKIVQYQLRVNAWRKEIRAAKRAEREQLKRAAREASGVPGKENP